MDEDIYLPVCKEKLLKSYKVYQPETHKNISGAKEQCQEDHKLEASYQSQQKARAQPTGSNHQVTVPLISCQVTRELQLERERQLQYPAIK
jgi:hypothetical protein